MTPEQASKMYHWIRYDASTNTIDMFMDNYVLSSSRICEAMFYLDHMLNLQFKPKPLIVGTNVTEGGKVLRKPWFFDFGEFVHYCVEIFYDSFKKNKQAPVIADWLVLCKKMWDEMKMDEYANSVVDADVTKYNEVGGWDGVAGLLVQYYAFYMGLRNRIIDTEITFGFNKEVKLGEFVTYDFDETPTYFNCYLTGRIDLLVDNGYKIGPVDHKTTHKFDGREHEDFNPHDGICGYILAIRELMKKYKDQGLTNIPQCTGGWIYHIMACTPSIPRDKSKQPKARFKTTPVDKTDEQLEDYKLRQLSTFKRIAELVFNNKTPEWNTSACNYMFNRKCQYKPIHEQPSSQWKYIIENFYEIKKPWDTREHGAAIKKEEKS